MPRDRTEQQNAIHQSLGRNAGGHRQGVMEPGPVATTGVRSLFAALAHAAHSGLAHHSDAQPRSTPQFHTSFPISCLKGQILRSKYKVDVFSAVST